MSRIVVKNLPKQISEEELKKHFSLKGNITDVRLIHKNGEFRRYAFIGFEGQDDAGTACDYFHNTFIKQAKLTVEICHDFSSKERPESWAQKNKKRKEKKSNKSQLEETSTNSIETETKKEGKKKERKKDEDSLKEKLLGQYKDDPSFSDFLKANNKGAKEEEGPALLAKQESSSEAEEEEDQEEDEEKDKLAQKKDVSDQDYLKSLMKTLPQDKDHIEGKTPLKKKKKKEFYTVVIRATEMCKGKQSRSRTFTKKTIKAFLHPLKFKSLRIPNGVRMVAYVGFKTEKEMKQSLQKDKSFLDGVRVHIVKHEKPSGNSDTSSQDMNTPWAAKEEALKQVAEPVAESGKLFVRNLWFSVTEELLQELFQKYGEVTDITLPICKYTRRAKGFATISFMFPEHAAKAMTELDGTSFKGRVLHIMPAIEPKTEEKQNENLSFKEKKAQEKKATAGSWHNWNTLFMGSGAVVDIMAERYNRSKQEILDSEGKQSVAVNLALGETQVVDETKRFLEENGVSLEAFSSPGVQRSKTVFLVKNLPAKTTAQELVELFNKFGELGRVVLPPSGVTGVVEFLDSGEAKKAFRNLAYSKFKSLPLYLEWAPIQVFKTEFAPKSKETEEADKKIEVGETTKKEKPLTDSDLAPEPDTTLYVKNLNFSTNEDMLKQHFEKFGLVNSVLIVKRRGESQGYGFVQFLRKADAKKALREINESTLDDHKLQVKMSEKTLVNTVKSARRMHDAGIQTSSKILVKNIPFQATAKEVRQLFVTFGELKTVRLPQKPGNSEHRGFGFVDYVSKQDAKKAFEALGLSTHLYDRRLVLEWAKEDETVEELRKRTADHFLGGGSTKKKTKVQMDSKKNEDSDND